MERGEGTGASGLHHLCLPAAEPGNRCWKSHVADVQEMEKER